MDGLTIIKTDKGTYSQKFSGLDINLDEARKILAAKGLMTDGDRFYLKGTAEVLLEDEATTALGGLIDDGQLVIKAGQESEESKAAKRRHEAVSVKFDTVDFYQDLSDDERNDLYRLLDLQKGLVFNQNGAEKAHEQAFRWRAKPKGVVQDPVLHTEVTESYTNLVHQVKTSGITKVNASAGGWGISMSTEATHSESSLNRKETTDVYYLATYDVPKVSLSLTADDIALVEEEGESPFIKDMDAAMAGGAGDTFAQYAGALKVLNTYGYYVPLEVNVGGRIFAERVEHDVATTSIQTEADSFKVDFEANLESFGYPVKAGGGYSEEHSKETTDEMKKRAIKVSKQARGGLPGSVNTPSKWADSLNNYRFWRTIEFVELFPTVMLLPTGLQNAVTGVLREHSPSPRTRDLTTLDMNSYVVKLGTPSTDPW